MQCGYGKLHNGRPTSRHTKTSEADRLQLETCGKKHEHKDGSCTVMANVVHSGHHGVDGDDSGNSVHSVHPVTDIDQ